MAVEVPLGDLGTNAFRVTVFDGSGRSISGATSTIEILRTHASATGIPATQTIAVKVRESVSGARNVLDPLITKGTLLPASGTKSFRAGRDLEAGERGHLDFVLYQDEGVPEPELNLCIGAFRVDGTDIPDRAKIRVGDEIIFQWSMSDSGLLSATVELPSLAQTFATPKFYAPQAGHQQFDLDAGSRLANAMLRDAREELESCEQGLGERGQSELRDAQEQLEKQEEILRQAHDEDTTRSVSEAARRLRQEIARVRLDPTHRTQMLQQRLAEQQTSYNRFCRESADAAVSDRFDEHGLYARRALDREDEKGLGEAEAHLDEMATLYSRQLWQDPGYIIALFQRLAQEPFLATDREAYDALLARGAKALERGDIDELRRTIAGLWDLQINLGGVDKDIARLATIVRG
jgi:molecular chaperone DnaK